MKIEWNKKYNTIAVYAIIVLVISIIFYLSISKVSSLGLKLEKYLKIFHPIIIGLAMAYIFNFILVFYEERLFKKLFRARGKKLRIISLLVSYITIFLVLVLFLNFILPQLVSSLLGLVNKIPSYLQDMSIYADKLNKSLILPDEMYEIISEEWDKLVDSMVSFGKDLVPKIGNFAKSILSSIWNIIIGIIISIYILIDKENFKGLSKKLLSAIFSEKNRDILIGLCKRADNIFGKFISGKVLDSLIIGVLTFIVLKLSKMPYTLLISFIIGITNIIPFFGPFIGAIPSFFIILFESPVKAFWFLIIVVVIQQIDGNIIGPKILGDSLGISAFWILFSLLVAGKIFGFIGLIIGVPLFVFIYSIIRDLVNYRLKKKNLPVDPEYYKQDII